MMIFFLDKDPVKNAEYHMDKHVVKMILEYIQILTAAQINHGDLPQETLRTLYKPPGMNNPITKWPSINTTNYILVLDLLKALFSEYTFRYGKIHTGQPLLAILEKLPKNLPISDTPSPFPFCPDHPDMYIWHRENYINNKQHLATWKKREVPGWYIFKPIEKKK
jgi:hypothetical protein